MGPWGCSGLLESLKAVNKSCEATEGLRLRYAAVCMRRVDICEPPKPVEAQASIRRISQLGFFEVASLSGNPLSRDYARIQKGFPPPPTLVSRTAPP